MSAFKAIRYYKFDVIAETFGGGSVAQAYALRAALVKCVLSLNSEAKRAFRNCGYITTDCRIVERKKNMDMPKLGNLFNFLSSNFLLPFYC